MKILFADANESLPDFAGWKDRADAFADQRMDSETIVVGGVLVRAG
ncbi:MAG: hypothetical protein AAF745_07370 [Planctomycetota bacterium]